MSEDPTRVLFVCLGNICRSPLAESVFRHLAQARGVGDRFLVDSAGTSDWHRGHPPDRRTAAVARARGVEVGGASRPLRPEDFTRWDYIIAMDDENLAGIRSLQRTDAGGVRIHRLREWDPTPEHGNVPDPYLAGHQRGFEEVHDIVARSCARLLDQLLAERGSQG